MARHRRKRSGWGRWTAIFLIVCLAGVFFFRWSNHSLQTARFAFRSKRLPEAFDGFVVVQLSDLHGALFGENNRTLLRRVQAEKPDAIVLTGDLLDRYRGTPYSYAVELGGELAEIAPTYFVTGNHEWAFPNVPELKRGLTAAGVTVLSNEYAVLERDGARIVLAGIDDPNGYADQKTPGELAEEIRAGFGEPFWLLLAHRNNYFEREYSLLGADLVISGHGHGGLIRLPFTDGLLSVERTLFPSYTAGFYSANGGEVFVSRGLGNSGPSFRIFNRPEIAVLTLEREAP